jgi:flagellin-like hook-associated protein FlgL
VAGGTNALAFAGFTANQSASATNAALTALTQADFTVNFGGAGAETIDFSTINSVEDLDTALGALVNGTGSRTTNGAIQFTGANLTDNIVVGGTVTGTGVTAGTTSATAASVTPNTERAALETEFNNLRTQIDQLAGDASFNGVNLLNGDNLTVIFNENNTSSLAITGGNFNSTGLGVNAITSGEFQDNANINSTLSTLDTTISTLRQQASTFGSNLSVVEVRQDFTKNLINTLETGAANLTLADTNEEGANLLALQTRQQLSSVALSLASQSDQNVLRLF